MRSVSMWQFIQNCLMVLSKAVWLGWREKKLCLVYGNRGMDLCQIAPGHKRLNSSPPAKENVPSEYLPTEAELGFFPPETNLFQSASNNWPLPSPGSAGRSLDIPRTVAGIGVCKSCKPAFQQVHSDLLRSRNLKDLNKDVTDRLGKIKTPSATARFKVDLN